MPEIYNMNHLQELVRAGETNWEQYGDVKTKHFEELILFDYTNAAQFANRWNWFERVSRGLILNKNTGEVVALPFEKFHNWGQGTTDAALVEATEKMDGSLGILYRWNGTYRIATRGSFTSEQAEWATAFLDKYYDLEGLPENLTLLFEIIYPENRVVVDYGKFAGLVLIGVRDRFEYRDYWRKGIEQIANWHGFPVPKIYTFTSIEDVVNGAKALSANEEGWVLRFDDGQRFKVKGDAYKLAHKLLTGISFKRVLEAMSAGALEEMLNGVPDEFLTTIKGYQTEIEEDIAYYKGAVHIALDAAPKEDRKTFALWVKDNVPSLQPYMFSALDGKDITPIIYKNAFKDRDEKVEMA